MTEPSELVITQADRDAAIEWAKDQTHWNMLARAFAMHRLSAMPDPLAMAKAMQAECAAVAKTGWVSADYNLVGIADADQCMKLCEHIETEITAIDPTTLEQSNAKS